MEKINRRAGYNWAIVALFTAFAMSIATQFYVANASDPSPLQDFCVEAHHHDLNSGVYVNGKYCKNEDLVTTNDFVYKGFDKPGDTNNTQGAKATLIDINKFAAVNTLGVSIARVDFGPYGLNTPHFHPLGSEIFAVLEGTLYAGFVTTKNKLYDTVLKKGDIIVFPQGLLHFQLNLDETDALAIATFGSQNPGRINIADGVFGTPILDEVLTKAFQVNEKAIEQLRAQFSTNNASVDNPRKSVLRLLSQLSR
uniref:Germin-like protein n=1 Tax=Chenopodium quinoa TaxID=63459 RepID=A0A803MSI8_CHEQI